MATEDYESEERTMSYRLEGAYSIYKYIQIDCFYNGRGKLTYEFYKGHIPSNEEKQGMIFFNLDETVIKKLDSLYKEADFCSLNFIDLNKNKLRFTDIGITTLTYICKGKETKFSYTYLKENPLKELVKLYSKIAVRYLPPVQRIRSY
ncbi:MAG: hypothetical protein FJZ08_00905 [Candidatus Omnitrophica bacterium]|nr:hypothetical protein [Candidatus Omnitrophota bacterium]